MKIHSTRLGEMDVPQDTILAFPFGLPGFPDEKEFAFLPYQPDSPFVFLQSTTEANLTFLTINPFLFFKDYEFEVNDQAVKELDLESSKTMQILTIVSIVDKMEDMTVNLLAPVVINWEKHIAMQVVLEKTVYTTRHRLFPAEQTQQSGKGGGNHVGTHSQSR